MPPSTPRVAPPAWGWAPTKEEHDEAVARRGRNYTDGPMRDAMSSLDPVTGESVIDRFIVLDTLGGAA